MRSFRLVVNAFADGTAPAAAVAVAALLRDAGASVEVTYSRTPGECAAFVGESAARGQVVVAVGGDGTVASIAGPVARAGVVLGIVPGGRGNDFARQLGLDGKAPRLLADRLLHAVPRAIDVIDVDGRIVVGSVYAGVDSIASQIVERVRFLPAKAQYPYAAVRALVTYRPSTYRIVVDGAADEHRAATVVVANSGYCGSGMHIAPDAALDDGLLEVVVVCAASRWELIRSMPKLYDGSHVELDRVVVLRGRQVRVSADGPVTAYGDGEPPHRAAAHRAGSTRRAERPRLNPRLADR